MSSVKKWIVTDLAGKKIEGVAVSAGDVIDLSIRQARFYHNTGQIELQKPKPRSVKKAVPNNDGV